MNIKTITFSLVFVLFALSLYANKSEFDLKYARDLLDNNKPEETANYITNFLRNAPETARGKAYFILQNDLVEKYPEYKRQAIEIMTSNLNHIKNNSSYLLNSSPHDFSETAKQNIFNVFKNKSGSYYATVLLLGHANVTEAIPQIKQIVKEEEEKEEKRTSRKSRSRAKRAVEEPEHGGYRSFAYHEALARMGDKEEIDYCIRYIKNKAKERYPATYKDNPELRKIFLEGNLILKGFETLPYIRQPVTIALLDKILFSTNSFKLHSQNASYSEYGFNALVKCLMLEDVMGKDQFGKYLPSKENIALLQKWMKEHYTPERIKSLSVLISGQIVNNYASAGTATHEKKHIAPPVAKKIKPEVVKAEKKTVKAIPKVETPAPDISPARVEKSDNMKYIYLIILAIGIVFAMVLIKRKKK